MDSKKHSEFTGDKASISRKVNGKFTAYGGYAHGINLELIEDKKIVQTWRADDWPKDHYSIVVFDISKAKNGAKLVFTQKDVPLEQFKDISNGWKEYYWKPMKLMLEND